MLLDKNEKRETRRRISYLVVREVILSLLELAPNIDRAYEITIHLDQEHWISLELVTNYNKAMTTYIVAPAQLTGVIDRVNCILGLKEGFVLNDEDEEHKYYECELKQREFARLFVFAYTHMTSSRSAKAGYELLMKEELFQTEEELDSLIGALRELEEEEE